MCTIQKYYPILLTNLQPFSEKKRRWSAENLPFQNYNCTSTGLPVTLDTPYPYADRKWRSSLAQSLTRLFVKFFGHDVIMNPLISLNKQSILNESVHLTRWTMSLSPVNVFLCRLWVIYTESLTAVTWFFPEWSKTKNKQTEMLMFFSFFEIMQLLYAHTHNISSHVTNISSYWAV